jgi:hypothetical protein
MLHHSMTACVHGNSLPDLGSPNFRYGSFRNLNACHQKRILAIGLRLLLRGGAETNFLILTDCAVDWTILQELEDLQHGTIDKVWDISEVEIRKLVSYQSHYRH